MATKAAPGRPSRLDGWQTRELRALILACEPRHLGLGYALWTRVLVGELIRQRFGVSLSPVSVGRLLKRLGLSAQRPLYRARQQDLEAVRAWKKETYPAIRAQAAEPSADTLGGAAPYWHSYAYDALGNRTSEVQHGPTGNVTRAYTHGDPAGLRPQALTRVEQSGSSGDRLEEYSYDEAGNMTGRTTAARDQDLEWDVEGNLARVTEEDGSATSYVYDADGQRLIRHDPEASTLYLAGMELRLDKQSLLKEATRFYSFAGETVAIRQNDGTLSWIHSDRHGTGQVAVNARTGEETHRYMTAFGADRGSQGQWPSDRGFVGGTIDASTGLTQIGARAYDPGLGRFISVDPVMHPTDFQQMHGYVYANNNPITFTDPDGRSILCIDICGPGGYAVNVPHPEGGRGMYDYSRNSFLKKNSDGKVTRTSGRTWNTSGKSSSSRLRGGGTTYQGQQGPSQAIWMPRRKRRRPSARWSPPRRGWRSWSRTSWGSPRGWSASPPVTWGRAVRPR